ncbi:hypothetical protein KC874_04465 [Candidatus Saccharibacteria bacterium]|nr:hypothetical protein [Candidatus Saccharibacteria bacterium]
MDDTMQEFVSWLKTDLTHFAALVEVGSVATDDPKQDGYSDNDLQIVVYKDVTSEMLAVRNWLQQHPLGDNYLLSPRVYEEFIVGETLNDISLKFIS